VPLFIFWIVAVSTVFGLAGILVGLWSKSFEQLNMPVVFLLTPLSMLGGSFFTMKMLPNWLHWLLWANPFYYFINGIRGAMIGVDEAPQLLSIGLTLLLILFLGTVTWRLYSKGYGLRE
jgi:ABC-2 type transport system permease protein